MTTKSRTDANIAFFGFADEAVEIFEGAVHGIDGFVIGDVVAEVHLGRREAGGDPDGGDAEIVEIVEVGGDAVEIADAVIVAVGEAAGINFVEDGVLPPLARFLLLGVGRCSEEGKRAARARLQI